MVVSILDDELWTLIGPKLLPAKPRPLRHPGRQPRNVRALLTRILFTLQSGLRQGLLPSEMGRGSNMSW